MSGWFLIVWVVWAGLVGAAVVIGLRWYNRPAQRRLPDSPADSAPPLQRYLGGLRWEGQGGVGNATMPLARLEVFEWGVRIAPTLTFLGSLVPTWEAPYNDLSSADSVKGPIMSSSGVRLRLRDGGPPIVFWTLSERAVLEALSGRGVPTITITSKLQWTSNR